MLRPGSSDRWAVGPLAVRAGSPVDTVGRDKAVLNGAVRKSHRDTAMANDTFETRGRRLPGESHVDPRMPLREWSSDPSAHTPPEDGGRRAASEALLVTGRLPSAEERVAHLEAALKTNRRIGMAIGILMGVRRIGEREAFELLRQASSRRNMKLRLVAEDVIQTGDVG